jgi:uncharacterized protein DUF6941
MAARKSSRCRGIHTKFKPMHIQVAVLCDAATENNGKLNLLGAFDAICAQQLPACSIALRMSFNQVEEGAHKLRLSFVDEDGKPVMPAIDQAVQITMPQDVHFVTCNFIVSIQQLRFQKPGLYAIDIALDGRQEASIPLMVKFSATKT